MITRMKNKTKIKKRIGKTLKIKKKTRRYNIKIGGGGDGGGSKTNPKALTGVSNESSSNEEGPVYENLDDLLQSSQGGPAPPKLQLQEGQPTDNPMYMNTANPYTSANPYLDVAPKLQGQPSANRTYMNIEERLNLFLEKNCPTDPGKWSASKAAAKSKFDVYPSAYANGWAAKNYKGKGGGWKTCNEGEANALCEDCWDGYKQVGGKMKNGKMVPNCVPISEEVDTDYDELDVEPEEIEDFIEFLKAYKNTLAEANCNCVYEAEYQGRNVQLGKPMQGDVKKFKVYVKNPAGNIVKVNFGQKGMKIRKSNPAARKSFRARMNCDNPGPRTKANYWSCRKW